MTPFKSDAAEKLGFVASKAESQGALTITDGALKATIMTATAG